MFTRKQIEDIVIEFYEKYSKDANRELYKDHTKYHQVLPEKWDWSYVWSSFRGEYWRDKLLLFFNDNPHIKRNLKIEDFDPPKEYPDDIKQKMKELGTLNKVMEYYAIKYMVEFCCREMGVKDSEWE